jgi:hypothetical protein
VAVVPGVVLLELPGEVELLVVPAAVPPLFLLLL